MKIAEVNGGGGEPHLPQTPLAHSRPLASPATNGPLSRSDFSCWLAVPRRCHIRNKLDWQRQHVANQSKHHLARG